MTTDTIADFTRQSGLVNMDILSGLHVTMIGAGAVGSYASLALAKMGIGTIEAWDDDEVSEHNLPNQFFRNVDLRKKKVHALGEQLEALTDVNYNPMDSLFGSEHYMSPITVVAVDSMSARKAIYEQFKLRPHAHALVEARMGGMLGAVYTLKKDKGVLSLEDDEWYNQFLYDDSEVDEVDCTAKSIIFNVQMISALICRSIRAMVMQEKYPREVIFDMNTMDLYKQD